jgi:hypothetical protein
LHLNLKLSKAKQMNLSLSNQSAPSDTPKWNSWAPNPCQPIYRFTRDRETSLEKSNALRILRADAFALSNRAIMEYFACTAFTNEEKAAEMNKLGMRTQKGTSWTAQSVRNLYARLDVISAQALKIEVGHQEGGKVRSKDRVLDDLFFDLLSFLTVGKAKFFPDYSLCVFPDLT